DVEMYGMGAAAGDYDNDGRVDLFVTGIGRNYLFHNEGGGHFREVAGPAGVRDWGWGSSAAWVDFDRDGYLDLFVCHYVRWSPATDVWCERAKQRVYCGPNLYVAEACRLFRSRGDGTFEDVSAKAGILRSRNGKQRKSKALGVAVCDYDGDGWPDLVVANDTEPTFVFHNNGAMPRGHPPGPRVPAAPPVQAVGPGGASAFTEVGTELGVALPPDGE